MNFILVAGFGGIVICLIGIASELSRIAKAITQERDK